MIECLHRGMDEGVSGTASVLVENDLPEISFSAFPVAAQAAPQPRSRPFVHPGGLMPTGSEYRAQGTARAFRGFTCCADAMCGLGGGARALVGQPLQYRRGRRGEPLFVPGLAVLVEPEHP